MPGSTGAVVYIHPQSLSNVTQDQKTGAVVYLSPRDVSGPFASIGVSASTDQTNLKAWLPPPRIPIGYVMVDNKKLPVMIDERTWWKFFDTIANTNLGGVNAVTVPDIANTVTTTQTSTAAIAVNQTALASQANANADSLSAQIQVSQAAALPGATQIPAPTRLTLNDR